MSGDNTEIMSDTPETDAEEHAANLMPLQLGYLHLRDHARKLECERDEARRNAALLQEALSLYSPDIEKDLESVATIKARNTTNHE